MAVLYKSTSWFFFLGTNWGQNDCCIYVAVILCYNYFLRTEILVHRKLVSWFNLNVWFYFLVALQLLKIIKDSEMYYIESTVKNICLYEINTLTLQSQKQLFILQINKCHFWRDPTIWIDLKWNFSYFKIYDAMWGYYLYHYPVIDMLYLLGLFSTKIMLLDLSHPMEMEGYYFQLYNPDNQCEKFLKKKKLYLLDVHLLFRLTRYQI